MSDTRTAYRGALRGELRLDGGPLVGTDEQLIARLRGAVAARFDRDDSFHGHEGDRLIYRYPLVHYRWKDGNPLLFCIGPAMEPAMNHPWAGSVLRLGRQTCTVIDATWTPVPLDIIASRRLLRYRFAAPWLALNQTNYQQWRRLSGAAARAELDRILVGNLLSTFLGLGHHLPPETTVYAAVESPRPTKCTLKGTALVGFLAQFVTNFELPPGVALGRSVSHGFGWIEPLG